MKNTFTAKCVHELALARKAWKRTTEPIEVMLSEREESAFPDAEKADSSATPRNDILGTQCWVNGSILREQPCRMAHYDRQV